jgi:hypothetical protein
MSDRIFSPAFFSARLMAHDARADGAMRVLHIGQEKIVMLRRCAGIPMQIEIPCSAYRGVALVLMGSADAPLLRICLVHDDADLSILLHETDDEESILVHWQAAARFFRRPRLLCMGEGPFEAVEALCGQLVLGRAFRLRRRGALPFVAVRVS